MGRHIFPIAIFAIAVSLATAQKPEVNMVERWGVFEVTLNGPSTGNPFTEVELTAEFKRSNTNGEQTFEPQGFYDGDGVYKIRFMPDAVGEWTYTTKSNTAELNGKTGQFMCVAPSEGNHGPVRVYKDFYLRYADGTPYHQFGTTCYAWAHQGEAMEKQTLETLAEAPFNKMRMCIFPKDYVYNKNEPIYYPYLLREASARKPPNSFGGYSAVTRLPSVRSSTVYCETVFVGQVKASSLLPAVTPSPL